MGGKGGEREERKETEVWEGSEKGNACIHPSEALILNTTI
jgi:hypothetical protein